MRGRGGGGVRVEVVEFETGRFWYATASCAKYCFVALSLMPRSGMVGCFELKKKSPSDFRFDVFQFVKL